ncbi:hypothetical protein NDU88_007656 [Pleurodeles waltl]|uniref:Uncharacterized protein n=1 Tax=Pleurodeles waltl TaxID=8319 RepID=A0AAV7VT76_PLEWA|nr:hypothetical protein NDU88_007656 [Pleurodeles waltl]
MQEPVDTSSSRVVKHCSSAANSPVTRTDGTKGIRCAQDMEVKAAANNEQQRRGRRWSAHSLCVTGGALRGPPLHPRFPLKDGDCSRKQAPNKELFPEQYGMRVPERKQHQHVRVTSSYFACTAAHRRTHIVFDSSQRLKRQVLQKDAKAIDDTTRIFKAISTAEVKIGS